MYLSVKVDIGFGLKQQLKELRPSGKININLNQKLLNFWLHCALT